MTKHDIKYHQASNPVFADADHKTVLLDVEFEQFGIRKFLATATDIEEHGVNLFCRAMTGEFGEIAPYVPTAEDAMRALATLQEGFIAKIEAKLDELVPALGVARRSIAAIKAAKTVDEAASAFHGTVWPEKLR